MATSTWILTLTDREVESMHESLTSRGQVTLTDDNTGILITIRTENTVNKCTKCSALKAFINQLEKF